MINIVALGTWRPRSELSLVSVELCVVVAVVLHSPSSVGRARALLLIVPDCT